MADTCLVLGGSGFLGREAVPELARSYRVIATSMRTRGDDYRAVDIRDRDALAAVIDESAPSAVVWMAAYRDPDFCEAHPAETRRLNVEPAQTLVDRLPAAVRLLMVSTDYVFDGEHPPYTEDATRHPVSVYGRTKMEAEDVILSRAGSLVVRVPLLMGWTNDPLGSGFFSQLMNDLRARPSVTLDDVLMRYPVWTRDLGAAMRTMLARGESGVMHYSTTRPLTRYRAAVEMAELAGASAAHIRPSSSVIDRPARRPRDARLATDRWLSRGHPPPHDFRDVASFYLDHFGLRAKQ